MAEEKPLFLIDVDRAIEGLLSSTPKSTSGSIKVESIVMYCVDLANALDGAGLEDLSEFAHELANQFKTNQTQSLLLVNDFIELANVGVMQIHPGETSQSAIGEEAFQTAKSNFAKKNHFQILNIK